MEQYQVTGMSCAACQVRVEKAVRAVPGVTDCSVNLLTNSMGVSGTASADEIIQAVEAAGYGASPRNKGKGGTNREGFASRTANHADELLENKELPVMKKRLVASLILLIPLMYVSMGHMMWDWPLPAFIADNHVAMGIYELVLTGLVMVINQRFFVNGFRGLLHRSPNMDTLVALGSMAAFGYSLYALFLMTDAVMQGEPARVMALMDEFYFESAAMILTLITVGKLLEAISKGKTTNALKSLMKLSPKTAVIRRGEGEALEEITVPVEEVGIGMSFVVRPGDQIPVDGIVKEGYSAVNEAAFTGESLPVDKKAGDTVSAGTINTSGYMVCEATRIGEDTALAQVIQMVSDAAGTKAPIAKLADRVSGVFVPVVIGLSLLTFAIWLLVGQSLGYSLARAISVLVISCPCALGLATPVAIMVGNGLSAKHGILFKNATALEQMGSVQIVAMDKTGTITTGQMMVTDVIPVEGVRETELLTVAAALEAKSEHPISKAITQRAEQEQLKLCEVSEFQTVAGNGLSGVIRGERIVGGNCEYLEKMLGDGLAMLEPLVRRAEVLSLEGKTVVYFARETAILGMIAVADTIRPESRKAIGQLRDMGIQVVMITGDHTATANSIARQAGVEMVISSVKPEGKEQVVASLMEQGRVAMVGDGINDAPALTRADIGIAIGAGTDIAVDSAQVVLAKSNLLDVPAAIRISRATLRNIKQNLFWAFIYNIIGIPLAAGCYVLAFGWTLNPMFGAAAMSLSSFCVVSNALRLNLVKPYENGRDKRLKNALRGIILINQKEQQMDEENQRKEEERMVKLTVKGMMCPHCEAHVKEALEKIDGVEQVVASHTENLVSLSASKEVTEEQLKAAVEGAGYEYVGMV